jgi:hypothetical protein
LPNAANSTLPSDAELPDVASNCLRRFIDFFNFLDTAEGEPFPSREEIKKRYDELFPDGHYSAERPIVLMLSALLVRQIFAELPIWFEFLKAVPGNPSPDLEQLDEAINDFLGRTDESGAANV